jgi:2-pyrone-4,6-dicarboxylate lactonase
MSATPDAPACTPPDFQPRRPLLQLPAGACDCHAHILGPAARHAYSPERVYTPPDCLLSDYQVMLNTVGIERAVLVQPSVYGRDNSVMLQALQSLQAQGKAWRGVAVVDPLIDNAALAALHSAGVRGVRVNVVDVKPGAAAIKLDSLRGLAERIAPLGWHMEFLMHVNERPELDRELAGFPLDVVFGHLGYMKTSQGLAAPGFQALLRLLESGRAWVKLTGPYRISALGLPYADVTPLAHALLQCAPRQVVWGSDWPHVMLKGTMPNDGDLADLLSDWVPDAALRRQVLVDNPARLYGF